MRAPRVSAAGRNCGVGQNNARQRRRIVMGRLGIRHGYFAETPPDRDVPANVQEQAVEVRNGGASSLNRPVDDVCLAQRINVPRSIRTGRADRQQTIRSFFPVSVSRQNSIEIDADGRRGAFTDPSDLTLGITGIENRDQPEDFLPHGNVCALRQNRIRRPDDKIQRGSDHIVVLKAMLAQLRGRVRHRTQRGQGRDRGQRQERPARQFSKFCHLNLPCRRVPVPIDKSLRFHDVMGFTETC